MSDIKKDIAKDFRELTSGNAKIKELSKKLEAGKASYLDADSLALELATALGKALHNNLGNDQLVGEDYKALMREVLPAGLHDIYEDVADYAVTIQRGIYLRQNIGLRVAPPDFNTVEVDEITGKATMVNSYKEIPGGLTNDIQHMAQNVATDTIDKNARLANAVGYEAIVTRVYDRFGVHTQNGGKYKKDCQWCLSRCGTDVPYGEAKSKDMFRRHPGCKCRIEYTVNGKTQVQTDWRSNQWADAEENRERSVDAINRSNQEEKTLIMRRKRVANGGEGDIILSRIGKQANVINPMPKDEYLTMAKGLERIGIHVLEAKGDDLAYLLAVGAEGSYSQGYIMHIGEIPSRATLFEEIIHSTQAKKYGELATSDVAERAAREIAANRMLLKNRRAYHLDAMDIEDTERNLKYWETMFEAATGESYEAGSIKREI